jgi:hypothetical protein
MLIKGNRPELSFINRNNHSSNFNKSIKETIMNTKFKFSIKQGGKLSIIIGLTSLVILVGLVWLAQPGAVSAAGTDLGYVRTRYPGMAGTRIDTCNLCHTASIPATNPYGAAYKAAGRNAAALAAIESADSDGDGWTNLQELTLLTFPGDPNDHPAGLPTATPTRTNTPPPTATKTNTPLPSATATNPPGPTATKTNTPLPSMTRTAQPSATVTRTNPPGPTATLAPPKATATHPREVTPTHEEHPTRTPHATRTAQPTHTPRPTHTIVPTQKCDDEHEGGGGGDSSQGTIGTNSDDHGCGDDGGGNHDDSSKPAGQGGGNIFTSFWNWLLSLFASIKNTATTK